MSDDQPTLDEITGHTEETTDINESAFGHKKIKEIVSEIQGGHAFKSKQYINSPDGIPLLQSTNFTDVEAPWPRGENKRLPKNFQQEFEKYLLEGGEVLMSMVGQNGEVCIIPGSSNYLLNQNIWNLEPDSSILNWYLYYLLRGNRNELKRAERGTTRTFIGRTEFENLSFPVPPRDEQKRIATVLYNVDQAIQKTDEIIEQIKKTKAGIAQQLFRYGFYEHQTESRRLLGEIPKDWDVVGVGEICEKVTDGTHRAVPAQETGKPCLTAKNIRDWGFDLDDIKYISEEEHKDIISRCHPEKGDLLYVKDGANTGMVQVNTLDFEFSLLNSVILMKVNEEVIDPHFLEQMLSWEKMKKLIVARRTGTGIRRVTITNMEKSEVLVPCIEEQREIAGILTNLDDQVRIEMELQERLKHLKRGLMQDLLSGTVRTTDTNIEVPDEIAQYG